MADTPVNDNGSTAVAELPVPPDTRLPLPEFVTVTNREMQQFPSPGTQRALKAETGLDYMALIGPDADSADRTQTQVWQHLRKTVPGLRWDDCADVGLQLDDGTAPDPFALGSSAV
jgi:hypothetical protein